MNIKIGNKLIGNNQPTYFIADIGANHNNDLSKVKELIYSAKENGADAAKFQHFEAKTIVSDHGFRNLDLKTHQSTWDKSVFEIYKSASINRNWTHVILETCKKANIDFFTSPYSLEIVEYIDKFVDIYKIGSGDITWHEIIKKISSKKKPIILATGASNIDEVQSAVNIISEYKIPYVIMQCNTNYTASLDNFKFINLNVLKTYKKLFSEAILGLSDHTPGHTTVLGAITLDVRVIEKHYTLDNKLSGPDHKFAMNPKSWKEMVLASRELELSLGLEEKKIEKNEINSAIVQRRALRALKNINKNSIISKNDLIYLRPCPVNAISPNQEAKVIGKKLNKDILKGELITYGDLI